jgi:flagellar biosynthesis protein FliR
MSLFNFSQEEAFCFFAILVRYSVLVAVLPFVGDRFVPVPAKILLSLALTFALFPALVARGHVQVADAAVWGATVGGIVGTIALEALFGLSLGFTAKLLFDGIHFGANLAGNFMGFAAAATYDPHQESQTQVVAELQLAIAMLIFLALDGHHLMLRAALDSYRIVGVGKAGFAIFFSGKLIEFTGQVIKFGAQIAAPVAVALFAVNVGFGIFAKAMPQLNVLVLSFAVTTLVGLVVMFLNVSEFQAIAGNILGRMEDWMTSMMLAIHKDGG